MAILMQALMIHAKEEQAQVSSMLPAWTTCLLRLCSGRLKRAQGLRPQEWSCAGFVNCAMLYSLTRTSDTQYAQLMTFMFLCLLQAEQEPEQVKMQAERVKEEPQQAAKEQEQGKEEMVQALGQIQPA